MTTDCYSFLTAYIKKICPYFFDLEPVMSDCPNAHPLVQHKLGNVNDVEGLDLALNVNQGNRQSVADSNDEAIRNNHNEALEYASQPAVTSQLQLQTIS